MNRQRATGRLPVIPACILALISADPALGQGGDAAQAQASAPKGGLTASARRISTPPVLDGKLDDAVWNALPPIEGFRQRDPAVGSPATEATTVRIGYDNAFIYVGAFLADSNATDVRATELRRDNTLDSDDTFAVLLDTYFDHRNAFIFKVNPRGTRYDAIVRNESRFFYADWDEQWNAAASILADGWSVEMAIPFKVLRFTGADAQTWGVNFERIIKRKNEFDYWAGWERDFGFHNVSQAGRLEGLSGIKQAERLRLRPYVLAGTESLDAVPAPKGTIMVREIGIDDLKYAVTSTLTADLAVNPDFAQTEVDAQQVNLTRFSLFFPEKRQFFIEGADSLRMGVGLLHFGPPPLEFFYSRSIGLAPDGTQLPVLAGAKVTGKVSGYDVGVLNVQTDDFGRTPSENYAVARVRKEVLGRSYVGAMMTNKAGGDARNTIVGGDARFTFFKNLNVMGLFARADDTRVATPQWATQLGAEWRSDFLEIGGNYIDIDPLFLTDLGFIRRKERMLGVRGSLKPRPGRWGVRQFELTPQAVFYHDDARVLRTREAQFQVASGFQSGDRIELALQNNYDHPQRPFPIGQGVVLPSRAYEWNNAVATVRSFNGRKMSGSASVSVGDFYDGIKRTVTLQGEVRPNRYVSLNPNYQVNDVDVGPGAFRTHLVGLRANISFSTSLLTSIYAQYNSAGQLAATQVRVNYIFRNIDNVYLVFNDTHFTDGVYEGRANRSLVAKVTYSLHR
jgi:Domain of unknown function (DUF5916)/Carbohydrate family 9 binding domain-like